MACVLSYNELGQDLCSFWRVYLDSDSGQVCAREQIPSSEYDAAGINCNSVRDSLGGWDTSLVAQVLSCLFGSGVCDGVQQPTQPPATGDPYVPPTSPTQPSAPSGSVTLCGRTMTWSEIQDGLRYNGYPGPWDATSMERAWKNANQALCAGTSTPVTGGTIKPSSTTLPAQTQIFAWVQKNQNTVLLIGGLVLAVKMLK